MFDRSLDANLQDIIVTFIKKDERKENYLLVPRKLDMFLFRNTLRVGKQVQLFCLRGTYSFPLPSPMVILVIFHSQNFELIFATAFGATTQRKTKG